MLRFGAALITLWCVANALLALMIVTAIVALDRNAPALLILFGDTTGTGIEPRALATINALAVLLNGAILTVCCLGLVLTWRFFARGTHWAFWSALLALGMLQICGFLSDALLDHRNLPANLVSTAILATGFAAMAAGLSTGAKRKPNTVDR